MIIPIQDSFIYVEPVFLIAEGVDIPQLQRVIATSGDKIAMQPTLWEAIEALYGQQRQRVAAPADSAAVALPELNVPADSTNQTLSQLRTLWEEARDALNQGDWKLYGQKMDEIDALLNSDN